MKSSDHRKLYIKVAAILCSSFFPAFAGPDNVTNRLMEENVSLLDFGIHKMNLFIDEIGEDGYNNVYYDWDENKIYIYNSLYLLEKIEDADGLKRCQNWFTEIQQRGGIDPKTGKNISDFDVFGSFFTHEGWEKTKDGKTTSSVSQEISEKISLAYNIYVYVPDEKRIIKCSAPLLSGEYFHAISKLE